MHKRIKELRKTVRLNQTEFAEKIGATQPTVAGWENGERNIPPARILQICQTFKVRREWLEKGSGEIFEPERVDPDDKRRIQREFVLSVWNRLTDEQRTIIEEALAEQGFVLPKEPKSGATTKTAIVGDNNSGVSINQ